MQGKAQKERRKHEKALKASEEAAELAGTSGDEAAPAGSLPRSSSPVAAGVPSLRSLAGSRAKLFLRKYQKVCLPLTLAFHKPGTLHAWAAPGPDFSCTKYQKVCVT